MNMSYSDVFNMGFTAPNNLFNVNVPDVQPLMNNIMQQQPAAQVQVDQQNVQSDQQQQQQQRQQPQHLSYEFLYNFYITNVHHINTCKYVHVAQKNKYSKDEYYKPYSGAHTEMTVS